MQTKEEYLAYQKKWREVNKDYIRAYKKRKYYIEHKEERETCKRKYLDLKTKARLYHLEHFEDIRNQQKKHRELHAQKIKVHQLKEDNIKMFGILTCIYCLKPIQPGECTKETIDHKQPISRNGTNDYENLAIACKSCNSRKHKKTEAEYREHLFKIHGSQNLTFQ